MKLPQKLLALYAKVHGTNAAQPSTVIDWCVETIESTTRTPCILRNVNGIETLEAFQKDPNGKRLALRIEAQPGSMKVCVTDTLRHERVTYTGATLSGVLRDITNTQFDPLYKED